MVNVYILSKIFRVSRNFRDYGMDFFFFLIVKKDI